MNREEAKAVLYEWQEMMVRNGVPIDTSKVQALRVAIEGLQGDMYCPNCGVRLVQEDEYLEPTQTHGRLIDAYELMRQWNDYLEMAVGNFPITPADITQIINDAPTVQADRPHGEWVFIEGGYMCSKCGHSQFRVDGYKYCPKCGARMEGGAK